MKPLDFGLAKATPTATDGGDAPLRSADADRTDAGVILGTGAYMSPEQARGLTVDKRTDVWAFGCVLYEMLTGRRAFSGDTISDTIAAILDPRTGLDGAASKAFARSAAARAPLPAEGPGAPDPRHRGCPRRDRRGVACRRRARCRTDARDLDQPPDAHDLIGATLLLASLALSLFAWRPRLYAAGSIRHVLTDLSVAPSPRRCRASISADGVA